MGLSFGGSTFLLYISSVRKRDMKTKQQSNYGDIEEDLSPKALAVFFIIGLSIALVPLLVLVYL